MIVFLQATQDGGQMSLVFMLAMFIILYFFMIRPQQRKQKEQKNFVNSLSKGMDVLTAGGLHGKIYSIGENEVVLEVDKGVKLTFEKQFISAENTKQINSSKS